MGDLSLCICTMDRPGELATALASVRAGSTQPHQLIVSDDGGGSARAVAEEYGATYIQGPRIGLGANRNACIRAARGDLVAFIDDDVIVPADFVTRAQSLDNRVVTTGWELNYSFEPPKKVTPHNASFLGFQRLEPGKNLRAIVINATVFPRKLFDAALFDEQIKYGYEEIDMAKHAVALGWRIVQDDALWVEHHPSPTNRAGYAAELNISRLYVTRKAYRQYEQNPFKACVFTIVAAAHHIAHVAKSNQPVSDAIATIRSARQRQSAET